MFTSDYLLIRVGTAYSTLMSANETPQQWGVGTNLKLKIMSAKQVSKMRLRRLQLITTGRYSARKKELFEYAKSKYADSNEYDIKG